MARIDDAITQANTDLTAARALPESDTDRTVKIARAEARLNTLNDQKKAIQDDINDAVTGRLPDATRTAKEDERKAVAAVLGIPVEQLTDEKLAEVKAAYEGQLSEVEREKQRAKAAEGQVETLKAQVESANNVKTTAKQATANLLIKNALKTELITQGVIHETEGDSPASYLDVALEQALKQEGVTVDVQVDDSGNVAVQGDVQGTTDAVQKVKQKYGVFFGTGQQGIVNPRNTPRRGDDNVDISKSSYKPNYSVPGVRK